MSEIIKIKDLADGVCGIYKLNYPNGKIYIGLSTNIKRRMYEHNNPKRLETHKPTPCDLAIKKYGKFEEIEILEYVDDPSKLGEREQYWIAYYKSNNKNIGYNLTPGGDSSMLFGENNSNASLTNDEVLDIRKRRFMGERKRDVYQDYKHYSFSTFEHIWLGRGYSNIGQEYIIPTGSKTRQEYSSIANSGSRNNKAKLNEEMVKEIRKRYDSGESWHTIYTDYKDIVSLQSIKRVCQRETWKNV